MTQHQRKTYKQLKDSVTVKKGALWQEACDDGTQEYILLDQSFNKDPRQTQRIYDRALVEGDEKNFVEVFKVTPEYMTRDEVERWEAFQGKKTAAKDIATLEHGNYVNRSNLELVSPVKPTRTRKKAATAPKYSGLSEARLAEFVKAYNSSRTRKAVARSSESVYLL
ncbi:hypothetical protein GS464_29695 [Rhodococcus hoagii]|nr:hypothetical protein [Prescottella equi]MBM4646587.1 hypothetical protein [Prescottella equi]